MFMDDFPCFPVPPSDPGRLPGGRPSGFIELMISTRGQEE
jgi:hypothetical protein